MNPWLHRRPLHIAHQGGEAEAPSNTMYAFATALAKGADMLEIDVHATADGHLVVCHDATVDRTTDGAGAIDSLTLAEVQRLDAAHWFVPGHGVDHAAATDDYALRGVALGQAPPPAGFGAADFTIPALAGVFAAFPDTMINIDIKATSPATRPYEAALADLIDRHDRADRTMVASFSPDALATFRDCAPHLFTSASPDEAAQVWAAAHEGARLPPPAYAAVQVPPTFGEITVVTESFVRTAHAAGLAVHVWTIDDEPTMRVLLELGVDGIVSNRPLLLEGVLRPFADDD